jgi:hypothetical protein
LLWPLTAHPAANRWCHQSIKYAKRCGSGLAATALKDKANLARAPLAGRRECKKKMQKRNCLSHSHTMI